MDKISDAYKEFAKDSYSTINAAMRDGLSKSGDLPMLVVSGEMHRDLPEQGFLDFFIPAKHEEPALAAAYSHIAAIQSAIDVAGKENVVVSFELNDTLLEKSLGVVDQIQELRQQGELGNVNSEAGWMYNTFPYFHAMEFAKSQGLVIVGSDPGRGKDFSSDSQERRDAEVDALGKLALQTADIPRVVVHVGGEAHFITLQGHPYNFDTSVYENKTHSDAVSPFEGIYGSQIFINSDQPVIDVIGRDIVAYIRNPENAIQLDPPGKMDASDINDISMRIQEFSTALKATQPETPTSEINPEAMNKVDVPKI